MSTATADIRCTMCEFRPTKAEVDAGLTACPRCGSTGIPMQDAGDVEIKINWHELRILGIWAENYAASLKEKNPELQRTVAVICGRIQAQHPEMKAPLTMSGELAQLREWAEENAGGLETSYPEDEEASRRE